MLPIERLSVITDIVQQRHSIQISELEEILGVSHSTVYRDILKLKKQGILTINSGVVSAIQISLVSSRQEINYSAHMLLQMERIASLAATLIDDVDSIFIGEGLICYCLAQKIAETHRLHSLTVVTNNFNVAKVLSSVTKHLYLIGGAVLQNSENIYTGGPKFESNLNTIFVNKAFTSVDGVDFKAGYTMQDLSQLNILSQLPSFCSCSIFLATSNKFGQRAIHQLAPLDFAHVIITDDNLSKSNEYVFSKIAKPKLMIATK